MKTFRAVIFVFLFLSLNQFIQAAPPPPPGGAPACWPPPCIPIDGGVSVLIAAGAAYGAKKLYDTRRKSRKAS